MALRIVNILWLISTLAFPAYSQVEYRNKRFLPPPPPPEGAVERVVATIDLQSRIRDESLLGFKLPEDDPQPLPRLLRDADSISVAQWALKISYHPEWAWEPERFYLLRKMNSGEIVFSYTLLQEKSLFLQLGKQIQANSPVTYQGLSASIGSSSSKTDSALSKLAGRYFKIRFPVGITNNPGHGYGVWYFDYVSKHGDSYSLSLPESRIPTSLFAWVNELNAHAQR